MRAILITLLVVLLIAIFDPAAFGGLVLFGFLALLVGCGSTLLPRR